MPVDLSVLPDSKAGPGDSAVAKSSFWAGHHRAWTLLAIGVTAFALRVLVVAFHPQLMHWFHEDTIFYLQNAESILHTGLPTVNKAPIGFPYILCVLLKLGFSLKTIAFVVQPLVGAIDCLLVFVLCSRFGHQRPGVVAAAVCAIHPSLLNSSSQVLSEEWAMFFVLLGLAAAHTQKRWLLVAAGVLLGFACAIRSPCLAMLLGLVLWMLWTDRVRGFQRAAFLCLGAAIPILMVSIHLSIASHSPVFLTLQNSEADTVKPTLGGFETLTVEEQQRRGSYFEFAWNHPSEFARERLDSFLTFASPWPFGDDRPLSRKWIMFASDGFVLLISLTAGFVMWRRHRPSHLFLFAWLPCCMCLFYTMFFSNPRYRVPSIPLLLGFSAIVLLPRGSRVPGSVPLHSHSPGTIPAANDS